MNNNFTSERNEMPATLREPDWMADAEDEAALSYQTQPNAPVPDITAEDMAQLREEMLASYMQAVDDKPDIPRWVTKAGINEREFVKDFTKLMPLRYGNGTFYDAYGALDNDFVCHRIVSLILPYVSRNVERTANNLMGLLRLYTCGDAPTVNEAVIPVANGTLHLLETKTADPSDPIAEKTEVTVRWSPEMEITPYRLPVEFHENTVRPLYWLDFLDKLLEPDDIDTLQEYLGYLLLPTTKAQKMLCLIGRGGEGKSVIGGVLRAILGKAMWSSSIQKIENNRFARADLTGKLCMLDDDMQLNALSSTGILKSMITNTGKFDVERKGRQSVQEDMYCRFLCFGNGSLSALYDHTDGFYRRQLILKTKPKDKNRVDDPWLLDKLVSEKEGIFLWMLAGLIRLVEQGYRFTISDSVKQNLREHYLENNNMEEFFRDKEKVCYGVDEHTTSKRLCLVYRKWCADNGLRPASDQTLIIWLKENADRFGVQFKKKIPEDGGLYRGFLGISAHV